MTFIVCFAFDHFVSQLVYVRFVIQSCERLALSSYDLFLGVSSLVNFCCSLDNMKVLGTPFEFASFSSSFLQYMLDKDVCHVEAFLNLGDVQITFGILSMFCPKIFQFDLLFSSLISVLALARLPNSTFMQVFGTSSPSQLSFHAIFWETFGLELLEFP